jgi:hypothetical protein
MPAYIYAAHTVRVNSKQRRVEHEWRVFENRILRWLLGPKGDRIMREWRRLHSEDIYDLYSSPNIFE